MHSRVSRLLPAVVLAAMLAVCGPHVQAGEPAAGEGVSAPSERAAPPDERQIRNAVQQGLAYLAKTQIKDGPDAGSWPAVHFRRAGASFAGLAFLANGHRPGVGEYGVVIDRALRYVLKGMDANGFIGEQYESGMYLHAIATMFALSCLGEMDDPQRGAEVADACRKSVALMIKAQKVRKAPEAQGGWRYTPTSAESDVSVSACVLQTLYAARLCGFDVPDEVFSDGLRYINSAYMDHPQEGAGYLYRPGISLAPDLAVSGIALYIKYLLERQKDEPGEKTFAAIRKYPPLWSGRPYMGYFYIGAFYLMLGNFQIGDSAWDEFFGPLARMLLVNQHEDGHWPLPPDSAPQNLAIGPVYSTAMGVLMLSQSRQYLPIYQRQHLSF